MYRFFKRAFDIFVSFLGIVLLSWLLIILIILVSCTSKGGPFFLGPRVGKGGKVFRIIKFRSMVKDCEGKGKWNIGDKDPRITKIGHFLRKTKLDELPQLFNVLFGQMSLVGYRPELKYYVDMYTEKEMPILDLKPGITDWASLLNSTQFKEFTSSDDPDVYYLEVIRPVKLKLQLFYRNNASAKMDIRILWWTVKKIILRSKKLPKDIEVEISK